MECVLLQEAVQQIQQFAVHIEVHGTALFHIFWQNGVDNWWQYSPEHGDFCRVDEPPSA